MAIFFAREHAQNVLCLRRNGRKTKFRLRRKGPLYFYFACDEKWPALFFFAAPKNTPASAAIRTSPPANGALSGIPTKNVRQRNAAPSTYGPDIVSFHTCTIMKCTNKSWFQQVAV